MRELRAKLERLRSEKGIEWEMTGADIEVRLTNYRRQQRIRVSRKGSQYVFSTPVLGASATRCDAQYRHRVALRAWERNAKTELVAFTFDRAGRLVGEIRHPADHLDTAELAIYLRILATEGDRFEYVLTGRDEH